MDQVTLALWGLNKDYTVALVGLFGTIAGALIAFIGIHAVDYEHAGARPNS